MNEYKYKGLSAEEWETLANPTPATDEQLKSLGFIEQENSEAGNKLYETADKLGIEHPDKNKEYEKLSVKDSLKDAAVSLGVEASHLFAPKSKEWQYESRTKLGESLKYGYRYLAGTASLFLGGGWIGGTIKAANIANKASKGYKIGAGIEKLFTGADIIKTGEKAGKLEQIGARLVNSALGGAVSGAIADYMLYRPEDEEGHLADMFGDKEFLSWLQSEENDTEAEAKFKNVLEGFIVGMGVGTSIEFMLKPLLSNSLKNIKALAKAQTKEEAENAIKQIALDEIKIEKFANKADMLQQVEKLHKESLFTGEEPSQEILENLSVKDKAEAQAMLETMQRGEEIFIHEDGTWDIKVNNWEDAYKVSQEEYQKQLLATDKAKANVSSVPVYQGDTALKHQNEAVKSTWINRGWLGANEELTQAKANKIAKNYKDKWSIDNNIKIEFVDGLTINGKNVEGVTSAAVSQGKKNTKGKQAAKVEARNKKNELKDKQVFVNKLNYITRTARGRTWKVDISSPEEHAIKEADEAFNSFVKEIIKDPEMSGDNYIKAENHLDKKIKDLPDSVTEEYINRLKEVYQIVSDMLVAQEKANNSSEILPDITIRMDSNARNPFSVFRAELEHARDIVKGEVPKQDQKHFSRYEGKNEGEAAIGYTYKKSVGKHKALSPEENTTPETITKSEDIKEETISQEVVSTEEAINNVVSGDLKLESTNDIESLINNTIDVTPEISGRKFIDIANDAEEHVKQLENIAEGDISAYREAFIKGDEKMLDVFVRKELAATKILSILADKIEELGMEAPIETQRNICDLVAHITNYVEGLRSGSGALLNSQKLVNRALETFGSMRLSQLTKEGIKEFADLLDKDIKEIFNLKFTEGEQLNIDQMKQELFNKIFQYGDGDFMDLISEDMDFAISFDKILDNIIKTNGVYDTDFIYKQLENLITERQYTLAYQASQLAPKAEGKIKTIQNWSAEQGGIASYYVHNLLSGVGSILKNLGSGFMNTAYFPARKILGGFLGGGEIMSNEGWNTYKVMLSNWNESWNLCKQAFLKGEGKLSNVHVDSMNLEEGVFKGFHNWDDDNLWHKIQNFHSVMTRAMGATDEFMSQLNYRSICKAKCLEKANQMANMAGKTDDELWINETADKLFKKKFSSDGRPLDIEAYNEAKTILYQNNLSGKMLNQRTGETEVMREQTAVMRFAESINNEANKNAFVKFIFPFVKTGANILQMNLDHNGLYALISPAQRKVLLSQTPEGALARSQVAFGMFSLTLGALMAANGMITGSAPTDKHERKALFETGWRPYSIKVTNPIDGNDYWLSYQGYEPIHTMLGFAADSFNLGQAITKPEDEQKWVKFSQQVGAALINNFIDKAAFRTGLKQLSVLTDPENVVDWQKAITQITQGFLPASSLIRGFSSIGERDATQAQSVYERLFNNYFNRGLGDYRRDVFGDRQDIYGLLVTTASKTGNEPEYQELARLASYGYTPSNIGTVLSGTKLKFKNFKNPSTGRSAYDAMQEELGNIVLGGRTLKEAVNELVTSSEYQSMPDGIDNEIKWSSQDDTKINALNDIFRDFNNAAKEAVIKSGIPYVDSEGRTLENAQEDLEMEKINKILNQNLTGAAEQIRSLF